MPRCSVQQPKGGDIEVDFVSSGLVVCEHGGSCEGTAAALKEGRESNAAWYRYNKVR